MDDNYFDASASPNLPEDDPLRQWINQVQSDPKLAGLMATDPQGAMNRMRDMGISPPPQGFLAYTDGIGAENTVPTRHPRGTPPGTYGGAGPAPEPYPSAGDPMTADARPPSALERAKNFIAGGFPVFGKTGMHGNLTSAQGQPPVQTPAPPPPPTTTTDAGAFLNPPILESEENPSAGNPLVPRARPAEAPGRPTDVSSKNKTADALGDFSKSLTGVKPIPPPAPNFVGTPAAPSHPAIQGAQLQSLLNLVGQGSPSPLGMTLGRLLATGKA